LPPPPPFHQHIEIALHIVQTAPYVRLALESVTFPFWIASHVQTGLVETETAGIRQTVRPGDVMVHPPHVPFSERAEGPGVHQWFAFDTAGGDGGAADTRDLLSRFPVSLVVPLGPARGARYADAFRALESAWGADQNTAPPGSDLRTAALAALLLAEIIDAWNEAGGIPRPAAAQPRRERFAEVVAHMETHLSERVTRDDLAAIACLHPGSFDRAFRAAYGLPPLRLLQEMRLRRARRLLQTTNDTLEAIARACGLGDAARLGRTFRARYGVSPGAWRAPKSAKTTMTGYIPPLSPEDAAAYNSPNAPPPRREGNDA
jgi:AraC-like DNA-binding protein